VSRDPGLRSFYAALGIDLPQRSTANVTVRCFASPDAHAHGDRTPSCSVSLEHGAWRCWACGASGGTYDAAIARGHSPASAIALMVQHGLAEPRSAPTNGRATRARAHWRPSVAATRSAPRVLQVTDADMHQWHRALLSAEGSEWVRLVCRERLWDLRVMRELELGYDRGRITIPIRSGEGRLRGVLRYRPGSRTRKMLAVPGSRLGLVPHPAWEPSRRLVLVEGPPDMIAARSRGWPAIAVPGDHAWQRDWAALFQSREVSVVMDCDGAGRTAAERIATDLAQVCAVRVIDLAPTRNDGFDLTDWLRSRPRTRRALCEPSSLLRPTIRP
jgi:hypothetical protein